MRNNLKRLLALIMTVTMLMMTAPMETFAQGIVKVNDSQSAVASLTNGESTSTYSSFTDAISAWTNASSGAELKLLADITTTSAINFKGTKTLDLNGYGIRYGGSGKASVFISSTWNSNSSPASLTINDSNPERIHKITLSGYRGTAVETVNTAGTTSVDANGNGTVYVNGGYITGGTGTNLSGSTYIGGAFYMRGDTKTATINGGTFVGNACDFGGMAHLSESCISIAGGSFIYNKGNGAAFNMDGAARLYLRDGEIAHNTSGIRFATGNNSVLFLGGNDKSTSFADNGEYDITLSSGRVITIGMAITSSELIHVQTSSTGTFTKYWSRMGAADPADYFTSDPAYFVVKNSSDEAELINRPAAGIQNGDTVTYYNDFSSAVSNWTAGTTLKLFKDVTVSSTITVPSGEHTLDLNGYGIKMTGSGSVINAANGATLNVEDSNPDVVHRFTVANAKSNGAGLATVNDALTSGYKTFTGGYITGGSSQQGGGIKVNGTANLFFNGGTIIGNQSSFMGAGIKADNNGDNANVNITVNGGAILYNTVNGYGAGICSDGAVRINGGTIAYNVASNYPGGIHSHYLYLNGGSIENNFAGVADYACGAHADHEVYLSGSPVVLGNLTNGNPVNLDWDRTEYQHGHRINIVDALTEGAEIGVTIRVGGIGEFTSGWKDKMGEADPANYFMSDDLNYDVLLNSDGEATIGSVPHEHDNLSYTKWTSKTSLPSTQGNYCLAADVVISSRWDVPSGTTNLCLNGHSITRTNASETTGSVIQVGSGATLNLYDCGTKTRYYTVANATANGAGLGTVVDESTYNAAAENARGTFKGGYITGGNITGELNNQHLIGGGVNVDSGHFTMYGGNIIGNHTNINSGGVKVKGAGASFTMNGGAILANMTDCYGGGISVGDNGSNRLCTVTMNGGTIARNWSGRNGGAIHYDGYNHTLRITGGSIVNNYTDGNYLNGSLGRSGGGLLCTKPIVSGNPIIKDNYNGDTLNNVYFIEANSEFLTLSDLIDGADIGVYVKNLTASKDIKMAVGAKKTDLSYLHFDLPEEGGLVFCDGSKDWVYINEDYYELVGAHHTHAAGTVWASTSANPVACVAASGATTMCGDLSAALNTWAAGSTLQLLADVTTGTTITVPSGEHTLDLNGYGIKMTGSGSVLRVPAQANLTVIDSRAGETTHYYYIDSSSNLAVLAATQEAAQSGNAAKNGSFTGGYFTGGNNPSGDTEGGGGITVLGNLTMTGGTVIGNSVGGAGGGICITATGVAHIKDSAIIGNKTGNVGAGVDFTADSTTPASTFENCVIRHNYAASNTGGVAARGGNLTLKSCEVLDNSAENNIGGVGAQNSHFTLEDVSIKGNAVTNNSNVYAPGLTIRNNNYTDCSVTLKGTIMLEGNTIGGNANDSIYIHSGRSIHIGGALTNTVPISIEYQDGSGTFTTGWADVMGDTDPADYFTSDNADYIVTPDNSGEVCLRYPDVENVSAQDFEVDYDGEAHGITVSAPEGTTIKYGTEEGDYTLDESPVYTNAGTYIVYYQVSQAKRTSVCGSAKLIINPIDVTVTVTGHNDTADYDGNAHSVDGYDVSFSTPLYTAEDFSFTGRAQAVRTNAGTTLMGLASDQFTNKNANFGTVTFVVNDGSFTINPIDVTVTVTGHTMQADYDGTAHSVDGYDVSFSTPLYTEDDFSFSGRAEAVRTNKGLSQMGLAPEQFENTSENFAKVTFVVSDGYITIDPIDVIVTISGHNDTPDYDGKAHTISGYDVSFSNPLYTEADFTFSGNAKAERTDAGVAKMGLAPNQFANTNENFATVEFVVNDGTLIINPIDVTVTITGHNSTVDYDGNSHSVDGYDVAFGNPLYTEADYSFSGVAEASRTDVGTTKMGLAAEQFENLNANFKEVSFEVTDGFQTVSLVDAVITSSPHAKDTLDYNGKSQTLFVAGVAEGGTLYYALGKDMDSVPANKAFSKSVPEATEIGNYYIWYKVLADSNHNSLAPAVFKVTLADPSWVTIRGTVFNRNKTPLGGAEVLLMRGNELIDTITSYEDGEYYFTVPKGVYNIIVKYNGVTVTNIANVTGDVNTDITMPAPNTDSVLDIVSSDKSIAVGGLEKEANLIRKNENIPDSVKLSVRMTVEAIAESDTAGSKAITDFAKDKYIEFYDLKVEKTIGSVTTKMDKTQTVLEIAIPCSFTDKREIEVFTCDGSEVISLKMSDSGENGTFRIDSENGFIYIYTTSIVTVAMAYQPYFSVLSALTLGNYSGDVSVKLEKESGGIVFELNDVSMQSISFKGVPRGTYIMTVKWIDGVENTITLPFNIK